MRFNVATILAMILMPANGISLTYTTNFDATENPISEGGRWVHHDSLLTKVKTMNGIACGTQTGHGGYDDSNAGLPGFGSDYVIEGTIYKKSGLSGAYREVELLLRWSDEYPVRSTSYGPTHANGYEINIAYNGQYMNLGRWMGAALVQPAPPVPADGDKFKAQIVGQTITCWWNGNQIFQYTDNDTTLNVTTGNPGIGFYIEQGALNDDFGLTSVTVTSLGSSAVDRRKSVPDNFSLVHRPAVSSDPYLVLRCSTAPQALAGRYVFDMLGRAGRGERMYFVRGSSSRSFAPFL